MPINLNELRKTISAQRKSLNNDASFMHSLAIKNQLTKLPCYRNAKKIALYYSCNGEVGTSLVIEHALACGKQVYLPILHHLRGPALRFAPLDTHTNLRLNRFGIPEPVVAARQLLKPRNLDLIITPLVAFDTNCSRVGMGSGYYDRSFAFIDHSKQWQHPKLVGLAYEFQKIDDCKPESWDIPLHTVVTEKCLYTK